MKKMKRILAMFMTLAMVLGMSMTAFAKETVETVKSGEATVTVKGLTSSNTTVTLYKAVNFDSEKSQLTLSDWVGENMAINPATGACTIENPHGLKAATATPGVTATATQNSNGAPQVVFDKLEAGAYVVVAVDNGGESAVEYAPMVASTFNPAGGDTAQNTVVVAKSSHIVLDKAANTNAGRGDDVEFTVTTTFPGFEKKEGKTPVFKLVDTSTGLAPADVDSITIGGNEVYKDVTGAKPTVDKKQVTETNDGKEVKKEVLTIDFTSIIGDNTNAGLNVVVTYHATWIGNTYTNKIQAIKSYKDVNGDEEPENPDPEDTTNPVIGEDEIGTEESKVANLTIKKVNETGEKLDGAKFTVYRQVGEEKVKINFVAVEGGYQKAVAGEAGATDVVDATDGEVVLMSLGDGSYFVEEVVAPEGYSINETADDEAVVITDKNDEEKEVVDTKLSALPSTGGIGTTIFTIGGCVIMIAAAAMFFANRKKEEK